MNEAQDWSREREQAERGQQAERIRAGAQQLAASGPLLALGGGGGGARETNEEP